MNIQYNQVVNVLVKNFPDFQFEKEDSDLPYVVAGSFASYLLECYQSKSLNELQKGLDFIEELHVAGDQKTKELATIGFLEGIQNVWRNRGTDPKKVYKLLGKESKKWWSQLNKFWQAKIKYVGETVDGE